MDSSCRNETNQFLAPTSIPQFADELKDAGNEATPVIAPFNAPTSWTHSALHAAGGLERIYIEKVVHPHKWDGVRALAVIANGKVTLRSRKGTDLTTWFPELSAIDRQIASNNAIVDGEIILRDGSVASFNELLQRVRRRRASESLVTFVAFDVVRDDGIDIAAQAIEDRRRRFQMLLTENERIVMSRVFEDGVALYTAAISHSLEGIVAKKRGSRYAPGRSRAWLKVKAPGCHFQDAAARHEWNNV